MAFKIISTIVCIERGIEGVPFVEEPGHCVFLRKYFIKDIGFDLAGLPHMKIG